MLYGNLEVLAYKGRTDDVMKLLMIGFEGLPTFVIHSSEEPGTPSVGRADLGFKI